MINKTFKFNHRSWNGRGGERGLATEVMDETFHLMVKEIKDGGLGCYKITFEKVEGIQGKIHASNQATGTEES